MVGCYCVGVHGLKTNGATRSFCLIRAQCRKASQRSVQHALLMVRELAEP
jgi:hypothetical protein